MTKAERDYILQGPGPQSEAELAEMERTLAIMDEALKSCPNYGSAIFGGAVVGMLTNFVASRSVFGGTPAIDRHLLRYAAVGAAIGAFSEWAMCKAGKGISGVEHRLIREARAARLMKTPPPPSPIVTKGHFAGAPRPLHYTIY